MGREKDDEMDTSEQVSNLFNLQSSSSAPANDVHMSQVQDQGPATAVSASVLGVGSMVLEVTPFSSTT